MDEAKVKMMNSMIRAVLQSSKEGVLGRHFSRDYRDMTGEDFPYRQLGFPTLDAYFSTIPDIVSTRFNRDGDITYHAVTDESTAHLAAMISKQRSVRKKSRGRAIKMRSSRRPSYLAQRRSVSRSTSSRYGPMASPRSSYMTLSSAPQRPRSVVHNARTTTSFVPHQSSSNASIKFGSRYEVPPRFRMLASPEIRQSVSHRSNSSSSYSSVSDTPDIDPAEALKKSGLSDYKSLLNIYCQHRYRGCDLPSYKSYQNSTFDWNTSVTFCGQVFSHTDRATSKRASEQLAAKAATAAFYNHIVSLIATKKFSSDAAPTLTSPPPHVVKPRPATLVAPRDADDEKLSRRIKQIIQQKPNGLWYTRLIPEYKSKYHEDAPADILEKLQDWTDIVTMERFQDKFILYPAKDKPKKDAIPSDTLVQVQTSESMTGTSSSSERKVTLIKETPSFDLTITTVISPASGRTKRSVRESCSSIDTDLDRRVVVKERPRIKPAEKPPLGSSIKVLVSHIDSCDEFYVHRVECDINQIMDFIAVHYEVTENQPDVLSDYDVGDYCVAYYHSDKCWCRAVILSRDKEFDEVDVQFIDFGNKSTVSAHEVRQLMTESVNRSACAIRCQLHGIQHTKMKNEDVVKKFEKLTEDEVNLKVMEYTDNACSVELRSLDGVNIGMLLCQTCQHKDIAASPELKRIVKEFATPVRKLGSPDGSSTGQKETPPELNLSAKEHLTPVQRLSSPRGSPESIRVTPPDLVYPDGEYWDIYVSHVGNSTNDVCVGLIGSDYSDSLDDLESKMLAYYSDTTTTIISSVSNVNVGQMFALLSDDAYYRVKVVEIEQDKARVDYVDHGDSDIVEISQLKPLPADFLTLPSQAITVSLVGLDKFSTNEKVVERLTDMTVGKVFVAFVMERDENIKVELIDTSTADDISVNEMCLNLIADEELSAKLPQLGGMVNGFISHIRDDGSIFVQIEGPGLDRLNELMNDMRLHYTKRTGAEEFVSRPQVGKLYCAKYPVDGNWYRAIVEQLLPTKKVEVFYVDYGNREIISVSQLREPTKANRHIQTLPYQARECQLAGLPIGSNKMEMIEWAKELLDIVPTSDVTSIKVVQEASAGCPACIELYIESVNNISLNETLLQGHKPSLVERFIDGADVPLPDDSESSSVAEDVIKALSDTKISSEEQIDAETKLNTEMLSALNINQSNDNKNSTSPPQNGTHDVSPDNQGNLDNSYQQQQTGSSIIHSSKVTSMSLHESYLDDNGNDVQEELEEGEIVDSDEDELEEGEIVDSDDELEEIKNYDSLSLPPPLTIVEVDDYMDIHVSLVTDPTTFMCQPWSNYDDLDDLVENMKEFYNTHEYQCPKVKVDGIYAALYDDDDYWYRVQVKDLLNEHMVAMYMLDLGHYDVVARENIQPLVSEFRKLPFQAVTASLAGVKPKADSDRFSDQAVNRFFELTYHKEFVAQVVDKCMSDREITKETRIKVILCDTSDPSSDVYIDKVLINEGLVSPDTDGIGDDR